MTINFLELPILIQINIIKFLPQKDFIKIIEIKELFHLFNYPYKEQIYEERSKIDLNEYIQYKEKELKWSEFYYLVTYLIEDIKICNQMCGGNDGNNHLVYNPNTGIGCDQDAYRRRNDLSEHYMKDGITAAKILSKSRVWITEFAIKGAFDYALTNSIFDRLEWLLENYKKIFMHELLSFWLNYLLKYGKRSFRLCLWLYKKKLLTIEYIKNNRYSHTELINYLQNN